jgi:NAD(P)-dependent dehydrogenase (short-subunit alcohol dehydrogenase family)
VFISGGATGIGEALVRAFHAQGAKVGFCDLDAAAGRALAARLQGGNPALFCECDVTDTAALTAAIAAVRARFGPIGVLLNNAANDRRHEMADVTSEDFDRLVAVNFKHQFFRRAGRGRRHARAGRRLDHQLWFDQLDDQGPGLSRLPGLQGRRARPHAFAGARPGQTKHPRQLDRAGLGDDRAADQAGVKPESAAEIDAAQCLPGRVMAEDIAAMALFLAADDSKMCTAQDFVVDAGWT